MSTEVAITLPRGLFDRDGRRHRQAILRPVTGHFEARLAEMQGLDAGAVSDLLAEALVRIGGYEQITAEHTAALSRGDRDIALLHIRRSLMGDRLHLVVTCANPSCGEEADLDLDLNQLAPGSETPAPEVIKVDTPLGEVTVREPTGADDAAVARLPHQDAGAALWSRLVVDMAGNGPVSAAEWSNLPAPVRHAVALALADAQSGPTLAFAAPCPSCRAWMEIELDLAALLAMELGVATDRLLAEVHTLAYFYHWSEDAILALPRGRRWRYLELLRRQTTGRPLLAGS